MVRMMRRIVLIILAVCNSTVMCWYTVYDIVLLRLWSLGYRMRARNAKQENVGYREYYASRLKG
jgi:hypothetical protein